MSDPSSAEGFARRILIPDPAPAGGAYGAARGASVFREIAAPDDAPAAPAPPPYNPWWILAALVALAMLTRK